MAIPIKLPDADVPEKKKRAHIKKKGGAVTWNMGKLTIKGVKRDIWHVRFDDGEHLVVFGTAPKGARIVADGKGSASKTAQRIGKGSFKPFAHPHGAVRAKLSPTGTSKGATIRFTPLRSQRVGPMFKTKTPRGHTLLSRRPLGRRK